MLKTVLLSLVVGTQFGGSFAANAQSSYPFVDKTFAVPEELQTPDFKLRMLAISDVVKDYDAVISSKSQLLELFPHWGGWPEGLTIEDNLIDLGWHHREFTNRTSFAYTVVSLDGSQVLGCVYINPTRKSGFDASVSFWARESNQGDPADVALETAVKEWIAKHWPFESVAYPGRDIPLADWAQLSTVPR